MHKYAINNTNKFYAPLKSKMPVKCAVNGCRISGRFRKFYFDPEKTSLEFSNEQPKIPRVCLDHKIHLDKENDAITSSIPFYDKDKERLNALTVETLRNTKAETNNGGIVVFDKENNKIIRIKNLETCDMEIEIEPMFEMQPLPQIKIEKRDSATPIKIEPIDQITENINIKQELQENEIQMDYNFKIKNEIDEDSLPFTIDPLAFTFIKEEPELDVTDIE